MIHDIMTKREEVCVDFTCEEQARAAERVIKANKEYNEASRAAESICGTSNTLRLGEKLEDWRKIHRKTEAS